MDGVRLIYNNDGENLWAVDSAGAKLPYHPKTGSGIDAATIRGSALDVADIADVDMICPFHNVPWWNSTLEPPAAHRDWYDKQFGFPWGGGGSQLDFVLKGGDFIGEFASACTGSNQKPFVTIRLNDGQMCTHPPTPDNCTSGVNNDHQFDRLSRFWWDHREDKEIILGLQQQPPSGFRPCCWKPPSAGGCKCSTAACELSWSAAAPRDRLSALVGEVARMYASQGVRGIELDFERGLDYFGPNVSTAERRIIMRGFVRQIRTHLDAASAAQGGGEIALGVRLTPSWEVLRSQGLDGLRTLVAPVAEGGEGVVK